MKKLTRRRFLRDGICGIFGFLGAFSCIPTIKYFKDPVIHQIDFDALDWYVYYDQTNHGWEARIGLRRQGMYEECIFFAVNCTNQELDEVFARLHINIERFWIEQWAQHPMEAWDVWDQRWYTVMKDGVSIGEGQPRCIWWQKEGETPTLSMESLQKLYRECSKTPDIIYSQLV